jgi:hypothetical protein
VENVAVVALEPVESAPPPAPTAAVSQTQSVTEPTPAPVEIDDDPFNIFEDGEGSRIVPAQNDALERARALQDGRNVDGNQAGENANPVIVPAPIVPGGAGQDGSIEIVMPDVDAMIDEITARATDPNRNPNVGNAGRGNSDRDQADDGDDDPEGTDARENRRKSARERINERNRSGSSTSRSNRSPVIPNVPVIVPSGSGNNNQECEDPFANLPEDMRPDNFPFNNC